MGYRHDRDDIVRAGIDLVLAEGLGALSFGKVAKALDISDRMVVYYFPSKDVLITAVVAAMGAQLQELLEGAFVAEASPDELMRTAWPILASSKVDALMAVYFEIVDWPVPRRNRTWACRRRWWRPGSPGSVNSSWPTVRPNDDDSPCRSWHASTVC